MATIPTIEPIKYDGPMYSTATGAQGQTVVAPTSVLNPTSSTAPPVTPTTTTKTTTVQPAAKSTTSSINNNYRVDTYGNVTSVATGARVTPTEFQNLGLNVTQIPKSGSVYSGSGANTSISQGVDAYMNPSSNVPNNTYVDQAINQENVSPTVDPFASSRLAITEARQAELAAQSAVDFASTEFNKFKMLDIAEIKSIAMNPELTKRLAERRISFINDPQSEYWLQRIALQGELDSAEANLSRAQKRTSGVIQDYNMTVDSWKLLQPDVISTQSDKNGNVISIIRDPLSGKIQAIDTGVRTTPEAKFTTPQIFGSDKTGYYTAVQNKETGEITTQRISGTGGTFSTVGNTASLTGVGTGVISPSATLSTVQTGQLSQALAIGKTFANVSEREKVASAVDVIQLGEELKTLLNSGNVATGPISGTVRSGTQGTGSVVGGATAGATGGAIAGSVIPGVGTAIGGIAGGIVGGIAGLFGNIPGTQGLGTTTPEYNAFVAKASQMASAYVKGVSGVAVGEAEYKRLSATVPSAYAQEEVNLQRIQALQDTARRTIANLTGVVIN